MPTILKNHYALYMELFTRPSKATAVEIGVIRFPDVSLLSFEPISKCSILFEVKEGENFNRRNILDISRINPFHQERGELDAEIGQKGAF